MKMNESPDDALLTWLVFDIESAGQDDLLPHRPDDGIFQARAATHMLAGRERIVPFDHDAYLFEPMLGGLRAFFYLSTEECALIGTRGINLLAWFPELAPANMHVAARCVLDGEVVCFRNGKPSHEEFLHRLQLKDPAVIMRAARRCPAIFVASDIVFAEDGQITNLPALDRKEILGKTILETTSLIAIRYLRGQGNTLYNAARQRGLEGIMAKHKTSSYHFGIRSPDWIAIKNMLRDNFIVCGYTTGKKPSVVLGQYDPTGVILYRGTAALEGWDEDFSCIRRQRTVSRHPFPNLLPDAVPNAAWVEPALVCTASFTARDELGFLSDPCYQGLRSYQAWDKALLRDVQHGAGRAPA
ncbi:MAG: hypothetical protein LIP28_05185 [Deltaproteobacteria bacterium]|nr:hypothetical protein [Deltaproteobacteria bacterium]